MVYTHPFYKKCWMLLAAAVILTEGLALAVDETTTAPAPDARTISLNFQDADISLVLEFYSKLTGMTITTSDQVKGKMTVIAPVKLTQADALRVIEAMLELKGFTIVKMDNLIKVVAQREAITKPIETLGVEETGKIKPEDQIITQIVQLQNLQSSKMVGTIKPLISPHGNILASADTNMLIIIDVASNMKRVLKIIAELDTEDVESRIVIKIIPLKFADENTLAETLNRIFAAQAGPKPATRRRKPPAPSSSTTRPGAIEGKVTIVADERLHALIIVTAGKNIPAIEELIAVLDAETPPEGESTRVYYLQNANAEDVKTILSTLFGETKQQKMSRPGQPAPPPTLPVEGIGIFKGKITVISDERTNALIITTAPQNFPAIEKLIAKLDIRTPQALIEVFIVEVKLDEDNQFGIDWKHLKDIRILGEDYTSSLRSNWGGLSADSTDPTSGLTGLSYWILQDDLDVEGLLSALAQVNEVNVISRPRIIAYNNQEANIVIGDEVPVLKQSRFADISGDIITDYEYRKVGIELSVTPRINKKREVALDINQKIDELGPFNEQLNAYTFTKREASTSLVAKDGQLIIIGGLIKHNVSESTSKVPVLGDIPLLGYLFSKRVDKTNDTELMVFLTPYVIFTPEEADDVTDNQKSLSSVIREEPELFERREETEGEQEEAPEIVDQVDERENKEQIKYQYPFQQN